MMVAQSRVSSTVVLKSGRVLFKGGANRIFLRVPCGTIAKEETGITPTFLFQQLEGCAII